MKKTESIYNEKTGLIYTVNYAKSNEETTEITTRWPNGNFEYTFEIPTEELAQFLTEAKSK